MSVSSILVGSDPAWSDKTVTITPNLGSPSAETLTASLTGLYLAHTTTALSGIAQLEAALTAAGVGSADVSITEAGLVKLSGSANFDLTWTTSSAATFYGFDGSALSGASTYTADAVSPYLWVAGRCHTPEDSILGVDGAKRYMRSQTVSPTGRAVTFAHTSSRTVQRLRFAPVSKARFETTSAAGGEFVTFWDTVLHPGARLLHHEGVTIAEGSSTAMDLSTHLGPYILRGDVDRVPFARFVPASDQFFDVSIPLLVVSEYS